MIVLALAQDAIILVLLNLVEIDQCIAALTFDSLCKDAVLVVFHKGVHQNMRLSRCHMHATLRVAHFTTLNLAVVTLGDLDAGAEYVFYLYTLDELLGSFTLKVDANNLAMYKAGVLDLHGVVWVGKTIDPTRFKVFKLGVRDEDIGVDQDAASIVIVFIAKHFTRGQVEESAWESHNYRDARLQVLFVALEREDAVTEHDSTRLDVADGVHRGLDFELADGFSAGLHRILWFVGGILLELRRETHA